MMRRLLVLPALLIGAALPLTVPAAAHADAGDTYSEPLTTAIADLPVATEVHTGYERDKFKTWIDADGDGCDTRKEVLLQEADDAPTRGAGCSLTGGRWYSYYDEVNHYDASELDIDHLVPLAEAWESGARSWTAATREAYANDLGDTRTLVAVTASLNRSKGEKDIAEWLPPKQDCRYLREWVAVKHRWGLSVDSAEKTAMTDLDDRQDCTDSTITVILAR